jgi:sortase A
MTVTSSPPHDVRLPPPPGTARARPPEARLDGPKAAELAGGRPGGRRPRWVLVPLWLVVIVVSLVLVLYVLEPIFQARTQAELLSRARNQISVAANETSGLAGVSIPTVAPAPGAPVAIIEIADIRLQQVVVEGAGPAQTSSGPGHVPGTAGLGQAGNSAIVGRRGMYGAAFGRLGDLPEGAAILVTTTEGQSVYRVTSVRRQQITQPSASSATAATTLPSAIDPTAAGDATADPAAGPQVAVDVVYRKTSDDQLTLVTSNSVSALNDSKAIVVTAKMDGTPFKATPQNGRNQNQTGLTGDRSSWPALLLAVQTLVLTIVGAVVLYRRSSPRVAWLLTVPPIILFTILLAEEVSRLLPAWA